MKKHFFVLLVFPLFLGLNSCEKDEGKLPNISFKTGSGYTSTDVSLPKNTSFLVGINASKSESEDVLKSFNISKSLNGGASETVFSKTLSGAEGDSYAYDFNGVADTATGQQSKYTFTVTNRDGLVNQVSLTVTAQ